MMLPTGYPIAMEIFLLLGVWYELNEDISNPSMFDGGLLVMNCTLLEED